MKRPPPNSEAESGAMGSKRRRRISTSDEDDIHRTPQNPAFNQAPPLHKIYNSSCRKEKPDELFRKDLISAMKLPDNEQLDDSEFWDVSDSWKQEWERGVQVPVNSKNVPNPEVRALRDKSKSNLFKLPKKLIRTEEDDFFSHEFHSLSDVAAKAEKICKYDMDDLDLQWLMLFNEKREDLGLSTINEDIMELILEDFETQCSNRFQDALKTEKGLGIEYDEDVICDVCRSPDCEEGNEMVFCDACNICVHQACYGIMAIPEGSWICRPCALNIKPHCILCPNTGGAMKCTSSGEKWAHVSCALWIPEVSIGCPEKMEPIMRISHIPASRWALICTLCRERVGACIQCSVKQCKVAYHVTCAFEHGLEMEMKTTPIDSHEEGVKMQSYCTKHSKTDVAERNAIQTKSPKKGRKKKEVKTNKDMNTEVDEHNARLLKIQSLEAQFHKFVNVNDTAELLNVNVDIVEFLYYYWVLKRRAKFNKPLLNTKCDEATLIIKQHESLLHSRLNMFVHLRQDLERVRNLCYMVNRREKIFRSYMRVKSEIFEKQVEILSNESAKLTPTEVGEVLKARTGDSLYDKFYCVVVDDMKKEENDKTSIVTQKLPNPYARNYTNNIHTRSRRRTTSQSMMDCYIEDNEMPKLMKCKSEENFMSNAKDDTSYVEPKLEETTFTHSPFVIKIAPKQNDVEKWDTNEINSVISKPDPSGVEKTKEFASTQSQNLIESTDQELKVGNPECTNLKNEKVVTDVEASNDKNSLCLSDKENINAHAPIKIKKTRNQVELRHSDFKNTIHDLANQKLDLFDDDSSLSVSSEINNSEGKKGFKLDKRNTRYQMRTRNNSSDILKNEEVLLKPSSAVEAQILLQSSGNSVCLSPDSIDELNFLSHTHEKSELEGNTGNTPPIIPPRRKRGRPRKIVHCDVASDTNFTVIKKECIVENDKSNPCNDILDLDSNESSGFKMSLRNSRECLAGKLSEPKNRTKKATIKMEYLESVPLKETNKGNCTESKTVDNEHTQNTPGTELEDSPPPRLNTSEPGRIIIRLRKDPTRESWKNDSSSSSDVFRIVSNDLDINGDNSISQFSSLIKSRDSLQNQSYSVRNDSENRHRYLMRERSVPQKNIKCTLGRS